ncbi:MAG: TrkH family potassium uptake protein, partial [Candidatus Micrarchaeota archaeon]|nr:TrkH family potassium uptake protein [Candidatus Micrarchaeota archaeon]
YKAEGHSQRIEPSTHHSIKRMLQIYGLYTLVGFLLLIAVGMPAFDAINHSMTSISTGGFSIRNESISYYGNFYINVVIMFLMILGATSFFIHDRILRGKVMEYIRNRETRIFWSLIASFTILMSFSFLGESDSIMQAAFHTVSAITTTGFTISSSHLPSSAIFLIMILMVIGGYAGSTAGGIKLVRFGMLSASIRWLIRKSSLPITAVVPARFGERSVKMNEIAIISLFVFIYMVMIGLSSMVLSMAGYSPIDSMFLSASAQGTVGLSTTAISAIPSLAKIVLMICMLFGRLEILPFLVLFYKIVRR